jgi:hypothetical protein
VTSRHQVGMETKTRADAAVDEVVHWRREQLASSGFAPRLAAAIAGDPRYDLHELIELVEHGCRPDLAARILAPLAEGDGV